MNFVLKLNHNMLMRLLKKYMLLSVLIGLIICGISVFCVLRFQGNVYSSTGEMVQNDSNYTLIKSYQQFTQSKNFTNLLSDEISNSKWKNSEAIKSYAVTLNTSSESPFFTINGSSDNKEFSKYVTNTSMRVLINNLGKYLSGANVAIVTNATTAKANGLSKKIIKMGALGFLLGFFVSYLLFILKEIFTGKIRDENYIRDIFNINNLGTIDVSNIGKRK